MGQLVQFGPLAAIVDAVSWQDYLGGIIQHHCSSQWSNHAVLVVGYDTTGTNSCTTCNGNIYMALYSALDNMGCKSNLHKLVLQENNMRPTVSLRGINYSEIVGLRCEDFSSLHFITHV